MRYRTVDLARSSETSLYTGASLPPERRVRDQLCSGPTPNHFSQAEVRFAVRENASTSDEIRLEFLMHTSADVRTFDGITGRAPASQRRGSHRSMLCWLDPTRSRPKRRALERRRSVLAPHLFRARGSVYFPDRRDLAAQLRRESRTVRFARDHSDANRTVSNREMEACIDALRTLRSASA